MILDQTAEQAVEHVGKSALCRLLGWSRPTLDLRLETDHLFPVAKRGTKGGGWKFDAAAVVAYLTGRTQPTAAGATFPGSIVAQPPDRPVTNGGALIHNGERTARQRREAVQAEILEDKLRRERSELVPTRAMRDVIAKLLEHFDNGLERLCIQIVRQTGASDAAPIVRELVDELRTAVAADLRPLLE